MSSRAARAVVALLMASNSATLGPETPIAPTMTLRWAMKHSHYPICGIVRAPLRPSVASMVVSMLDTIDATRLSTDVLSMRLETLPTNKRTSPGGCEGAEAVGSIPILLTAEDINASYRQGVFLL